MKQQSTLWSPFQQKHLDIPTTPNYNIFWHHSSKKFGWLFLIVF